MDGYKMGQADLVMPTSNTDERETPHTEAASFYIPVAGDNIGEHLGFYAQFAGPPEPLVSTV